MDPEGKSVRWTIAVACVLVAMSALAVPVPAETVTPCPFSSSVTAPLSGTDTTKIPSVQNADPSLAGRIQNGRVRSILTAMSTQPPIIASPCPGQEWVKTYESAGGGGVTSIQQTSDGGFIVGFSYGLQIMKLDGAGTVQWARDYSGGLHGFLKFVRQTSDGGYVLVGETNARGAGSNDGWVIKTDASGAIEWQRTFGGTSGDFLTAIRQTSDGGYVGAGDSASAGGDPRIWVVRLDPIGHVAWERTYDVGRAWSVDLTPDGGFAVAGGQGLCCSFGGMLAMRLDGLGNVIWQRVLTVGSGPSEARSIRATLDGGFIVGGFVPSGGSIRDVVVKLDSAGNVQWRRAYTSHTQLWVVDGFVQQASDGAYILASSISTSKKAGAGSEDFAIVKIDAAGNVIWAKSYGTDATERGRTAALVTDGSIVIAGLTSSYSSPTSGWIIRTDSSGAVASVCPAGIGAALNVSPTTPRQTTGATSPDVGTVGALEFDSTTVAIAVGVQTATLCVA